MACVLLAACERGAPDANNTPRDGVAPRAGADAQPAAEAAAPAAPPAAALEDVVETAPTHVVGISYPKTISGEPGLAVELKRYADRQREELAKAVAGRGADAPPYDLTLSFSQVYESPQLIAVAADGSTYTGGDASRPLAARFVWLRDEDRLLTAADLVPDESNWTRIAEDVRSQLRTAYAQRIEADGMPAAERSAATREAAKRIERGTAAGATHFAMFEPVAGPGGRIGALRFVFPAAQLDTGLHGTHTVEVPADALRPLVAPQYRDLFAAPAG
ncbi:hypothetical protein [Cognatilysobacter bugurensis]|nr:hypothetical protein [Lysobacter bugurensis]